MMPGFFSEMPKNLMEKGTWKIEVFALFPCKDTVVYSREIEGSRLKAYVSVRLQALKKDIVTSHSSYGIAWNMEDVSTGDMHGYKNVDTAQV